ncbi:MAG: DUF1223 domain-containing protein [Hyphomonadaceae bacterium]
MKAILATVVSALFALAIAPSALGQRGGMNVPEHPARPVVMELFSSQGCGNCPAANANLAKLAERSDVIAITYPVNIWDYLGWDDTFAKPAFTERQKLYNRALGYRGPYTPQVVYSGAVHGPGTSIAKIEERFAVRDISPYPATISFEKDLVLVSGDLPDKVTKAGIVVAHFHPGLTKVTPGGGTNKGKPMTYWNLVTRLEQIGEWKGGAQRFPVKCPEGCVVMVQKDGAEGHVLGVAQKR